MWMPPWCPSSAGILFWSAIVARVNWLALILFPRTVCPFRSSARLSAPCVRRRFRPRIFFVVRFETAWFAFVHKTSSKGQPKTCHGACGKKEPRLFPRKRRLHAAHCESLALNQRTSAAYFLSRKNALLDAAFVTTFSLPSTTGVWAMFCQFVVSRAALD